MAQATELGGTGPAARILECTPQWVRDLAKAGRLKPVARTVDGTLIFDLDSVRQYKRALDAERKAKTAVK